MGKSKVYEITPDDVARDIKLGNWKLSGAHFQTLTFYYNMLLQLRDSCLWRYLQRYTEIQHMEEEGEQLVGCEAMTVHDWGCGFGAGTALLQATFPTSKVVGLDYAPVVIEMARARWPVLDFQVKNIHDADDLADVIITSHTIEHMQDPAAVIEKLRQLCLWLVVVVPVVTHEKDGGHHDAVPTQDWINSISPAPLEIRTYTTVRLNKTEQPLMPESNVLMIMQGKR